MLKKRINYKFPRKVLLLFEILTILLLFIYQKETVNRFTFLTFAGLIILIYISNIILIKVSPGDNYIFLIVTMLISIGVVMIYRIDVDLGIRQLIWLLVGISVFFMTYFILKYIKGWSNWIKFYTILSYILFIATFVLGTRKKGAINWINIGGFTFQPTEITKLLLIFILSAYYANFSEFKKNKHSSYYLMAIIYSFLFLLFLQKDLGTVLIFYGVYLFLQFIYEEERKLLLYNIGSFIVGGSIGYIIFDHVKVRFRTWINPWKYIDSQGYQITQSLFAISEGGFFGTGLGLGYPSFIPEVHTDFIFAAICEEMGIFTGIGIIMLFMILVYRGFKIAIEQEVKFYRILALGVSILFGIQSFIILGGVIKMIPLTGITIPFISYGGSSIFSSFIALAILQVASEDIMLEEDENEQRD